MGSQSFTSSDTFDFLSKKNLHVTVDFGVSGGGNAFNFDIPIDSQFAVFSNIGNTNFLVDFDNLQDLGFISIFDSNSFGLIVNADGSPGSDDRSWNPTSTTSVATDPTVTFDYDDADPPVLTLNSGSSLFTTSIEENTASIANAAGTVDSDFTPRYSLVSSGNDDNSYVGIDPDTGDVYFLGAPDFENPLDSDADNVYDFSVVLLDDSGASVSQEWLIDVGDVSEGPIAQWLFDDASGTTATDNTGTGHNLTLSGAPIWGSGIDGGALILDGSNDRGATGTISFSGTTTITGLIKIIAYPANQALIATFSQTNEPSGEYSTTVGIDSTGHLIGYCYDGATKRAASSAIIPLNTWSFFAVTFEDGQFITCYLNDGGEDGIIALGTQYSSWTSGPVIKVGGSTGGTGSTAFQNFLNAQLDDLRLYDTILTETDLDNIFATYTFLTNYTLTASSGTFTLTGTAANLLDNHVVSASSGTYALTGTAALLEHNQFITASSGTYALTGTDAGLYYNHVLPAGIGSYVYTGTDATLTVPKRLSADSGLFSFSGTAAGLLYHRIMTASAGSYVLTGTATNLGFFHYLAADSGTYTLTGTTASLLFNHKLSADSGTYAIIALDILFHWSVILHAAAGSYTFEGTDASFETDHLDFTDAELLVTQLTVYASAQHAPNQRTLFLKFDEVAGNAAFDSSGYGYTATYEGPFGDSKWNNGSIVINNDYFTIPAAPFNFVGDFSFNCWVKSSSLLFTLLSGRRNGNVAFEITNKHVTIDGVTLTYAS